MDRFTGRPEWEPKPFVLAEIERATQAEERRASRNPIVRFCGLCFIVGLLGVGLLSLVSPRVANSYHAPPVVSRPSRIKHRARHSRRAHSSTVGTSINSQRPVPGPTK
jgi:hypothetical protein